MSTLLCVPMQKQASWWLPQCDQSPYSFFCLVVLTVIRKGWGTDCAATIAILSVLMCVRTYTQIRTQLLILIITIVGLIRISIMVTKQNSCPTLS